MNLKVIGVDFSCAPKKNKPIVVSIGRLTIAYSKLKVKPSSYVSLDTLIVLESLHEFEKFLSRSKNWVGGFDLPFGMPRALVENFHWPVSWSKFAKFYCSEERNYLRSCFKAWCDDRPVGKKYAWRQTDMVAKSSSAMRWTNPPVAWMMHAGLMKMLDQDLIFPAHNYPVSASKIYNDLIKKNNNKKPFKIALEAYPALTARLVTKNSYKSDDKNKQDSERLGFRKAILKGLINDEVGLDLTLLITRKMSGVLLEDGKGDYLDSTICMLQASSSILKKNFGISKNVDPLEGWIICS